MRTTNLQSLQNQRESFGHYYLDSVSAGYPVYQHHHGSLYLYQQDGIWLISDKIGSRAGGVQNQGDPSMCPYRFKTSWEYADVSKRGWQWSYDYDADMVCAVDGCSVTKCGHRATCTDLGGEGSCSCDIGYDGNPYSRCYPIEVPDDCSCTRLKVSSDGEAGATQSDKMGNYFLFGYHDDKVVYQHESGLEYLFHAHGQAWAIGADVGGLRVGVINFSNHSCPYHVDTAWKYSTQGHLSEDPSLIVECDRRSIIQNPINHETQTPPATTTSTDLRLSAKNKNNAASSLLNGDYEQLETLLYRNYVNQPPSATEHGTVDTTIPHIFYTTTEPSGIFSVNTGDKGIIKVFDDRPTKIHDLKTRKEKIPESFFDYLSNSVQGDGQSLSSSDQDSGESYKVYLVSTTPNPNFFETNPPPRTRSPRTPSPKLRSSMGQLLPTAIPKRLPATENTTSKTIQHFLNQLGVKTTSGKKQKKPEQPQHQASLHPAYTSLPINYDKAEGESD